MSTYHTQWIIILSILYAVRIKCLNNKRGCMARPLFYLLSMGIVANVLCWISTDASTLSVDYGPLPPSVYSVVCSGTESSIFQCTYSLSGFCATNKLAAVQCGGQLLGFRRVKVSKGLDSE